MFFKHCRGAHPPKSLRDAVMASWRSANRFNVPEPVAKAAGNAVFWDTARVTARNPKVAMMIDWECEK